jgi:hypothetical protein
LFFPEQEVKCWGIVIKGSRGQGFKGPSERLKNYNCLKLHQKSYELGFKIYMRTAKSLKEEKYDLTAQIRRSVVLITQNVKDADKVFKQQTLEPLNPWTLGPLGPWALFSN